MSSNIKTYYISIGKGIASVGANTLEIDHNNILFYRDEHIIAVFDTDICDKIETGSHMDGYTEVWRREK